MESQAFSFGTIFGIKALLLAGGIIERVVDTLAAAEQTITLFHVRYRD
jgi:hypothetical protein